MDFSSIPDIEPIDEIDIVIEDDDIDFNVQELLSSSEVPPIIRIVNAIISEAIRYKTSDIHIEPKTKYTVIRFRMDGMLNDKIRIPADLHPATISRIKILAKLDISERRLPQDGRITVKSGMRMVDLRVSTMPSINGEKVVMRILDKSASIQELEGLGFLESDLHKINKLIKKPQGIIIATGPTGSGKTTALYSILNRMLSRSKNFETIEDPVEYFMEEAKLFEMARLGGLTTLVEDGLKKVRLGITTLDELLRVVGPQIRHERLCENCHNSIDAKFLYCPYCGNFKHNVCTECKTVLAEDWKVCPSCGAGRVLTPGSLPGCF